MNTKYLHHLSVSYVLWFSPSHIIHSVWCPFLVFHCIFQFCRAHKLGFVELGFWTNRVGLFQALASKNRGVYGPGWAGLRHIQAWPGPGMGHKS